MTKIILTFNETVLKEIQLDRPQLTIGRKPDNDLVIDSAAVSGHHARITEVQGTFFLEDLGSANGTFLNDRKVTREPLKPADRVMIGKHLLVYHDEVKKAPTVPPPPQTSGPGKTTIPAHPPQQEFSQEGRNPSAAPTPPLKTLDSDKIMAPDFPTRPDLSRTEGTPVEAPYPKEPKERVGILQIVEGHTDRRQYQLTDRLAIIGSQDNATVKLTGWFAPKTAALISRRNEGYSVSLSKDGKRVLLNGLPIQGRADLKDGDLLEVTGVKMYFYLEE